MHEGTALHPDHLTDLRRSGLTDETILAAGLQTVRPEDIRKITAIDAIESLLEIPYGDGFSRYKVFPIGLKTKNGTLRYLQPAKSGAHLYIPPTLPAGILQDPTQLLGIAEGEKKALKATQDGIPCVGIGGLWNWLQNGRLLDTFKAIALQNRPVYLFPDSDVWHRQDLLPAVYRLGAALQARGAHVLVKKLPDSPGKTKQGLDDFLVAYDLDTAKRTKAYPLTDPIFAKARTAAERAHLNGNRSPRHADNTEEVDPQTSDIGVKKPLLVCAADVEPESVTWLWEPYIPRGKLTILEADPGEGNTFLALAIAAALSRGRTPYSGESCEPGTIIYLSAEDGLGDTLRPRLEACGADLERVHFLTGWACTTDDHSEVSGVIELGDIATLERALLECRRRPALLIIDPLQAFLGSKIDLHRANETRPVMMGLANLAARYGCAMLIIRHLSKASQDRAVYRGLGSIDFSASVRSVLTCGKNPERPTDPAAHIMAHAKSNLAAMGSSLEYEIREGCFLWAGLSRVTAEQLQRPMATEDERSAVDEAKDFLRDFLGNGPQTAKVVAREARKAGISEITLRRAKAGIVRLLKVSVAGGERGGGMALVASR
jgi:AAA domain/Domain of unknown function (DUF3854)